MSFQPGAMLYTQGFGSRPENVEVPFITNRAPTTSDILFPVGKRWIDTAAGNEYTLVNLDTISGVTSANWALLGGTSTDLNISGSITAGTSITATDGNIVISGAARQLQVHGGAATDFIGLATLASGTVTVANTNIAATDRIFLAHAAINASTGIGTLHYTITPATSFVITSLDATGATETGDLSDVAYFIVRQV